MDCTSLATLLEQSQRLQGQEQNQNLQYQPLPELLKLQSLKLKTLNIEHNSIINNIAGLQDDIALLTEEKKHGSIEIGIERVQTQASNQHHKSELLKEQIFKLKSDLRQMKRNSAKFKSRRERQKLSKVKKSSLHKAMEPIYSLHLVERNLLKQHEQMKQQYFDKAKSTHRNEELLKAELKRIQKYRTNIHEILNDQDTRPNWKAASKRIGKYDMRSSLKLGVHEALLEPVTRETSTKYNLDIVLNILKESKQKLDSQEKCSEKLLRLQLLYKEADRLYHILAQKIRQLPQHYHIVDKAIENWQYQTFKRFDSLGNDTSVPPWLRFPKTGLFDRTFEEYWTHDRTRQVVDDIWSKKHASNCELTLPGFMFKYAIRQAATKKKRLEWSINFVHALRHYSNLGDSVCGVTDLILHLHWCNDYYVYMEKMMTQLHSALDVEKRETLPISVFEELLRRIFPYYDDLSIERLLDAARRDTMFMELSGIIPEKAEDGDLFVQHMFALGHRGVNGSSFGIFGTKMSETLDERCVEKWPTLHSWIVRTGETQHSTQQKTEQKQEKIAAANKEQEQKYEKRDGEEEEDNEEHQHQHKRQRAHSTHSKEDAEKAQQKQHHTRHHTHHKSAFGFIACLCHHYLHQVKNFHRKLHEELKVFDFTGSGKILAHFVPVAINTAACGQLNAHAIEILVKNVKGTKLDPQQKQHEREHSPIVDINSFVLQCQLCLALPFVP